MVLAFDSKVSRLRCRDSRPPFLRSPPQEKPDVSLEKLRRADFFFFFLTLAGGRDEVCRKQGLGVHRERAQLSPRVRSKRFQGYSENFSMDRAGMPIGGFISETIGDKNKK